MKLYKVTSERNVSVNPFKFIMEKNIYYIMGDTVQEALQGSTFSNVLSIELLEGDTKYICSIQG